MIIAISIIVGLLYAGIVTYLLIKANNTMDIAISNISQLEEKLNSLESEYDKNIDILSKNQVVIYRYIQTLHKDQTKMQSIAKIRNRRTLIDKHAKNNI